MTGYRAGLALTLLLVGVALLSIVWTPEPPTHLRMGSRFLPPGAGAAATLGTDQFGRDVASLLMVGLRNSLGIAAIAVALGGLIGSAIGLAAASLGRWVDGPLMRLTDVAFALPPVLSAIMLGAWLGPGRWSATIAIALFLTPVFARLARASALQTLALGHVLAARALGVGRFGVLRRHVLGFVAPGLIVQAALQLGGAILAEAALSYLGVGPRPPTPSLGRMLGEAQPYLNLAPHLAWLPGAVLALCVLGFNLLGDGLAARLRAGGSAKLLA